MTGFLSFYLSIFVVGFIAFWIGVTAESENMNLPFALVLLAFFLLPVTGLIRSSSLNEAYKQGQAECASGHMRYEKVETPDGTGEWVLKDSVDTQRYF